MPDYLVTDISIADTTEAPTLAEAGVNIPAASFVHLDADGKLQLSDANVVTAAKVDGMALFFTPAGDQCPYIERGDIRVINGDPIFVSQTYVLSRTPGLMCPVTDLAAGDELVYLAYGVSASVYRLMIIETDIVKP